MSDPLATAASAAGLVCLGLTVCAGLLDSYNAWTDQHSDVSAMWASLEALNRTPELLEEQIRHPQRSADRGHCEHQFSCCRRSET